MFTLSALQALAGRPLVRRAADVVFGRFARRRARQLDRLPAAAVQEQTLLRLVRAGALSGIAARGVSPPLRPYTFPPLDLALMQDWEQKLDVLARRGAALPVTMLSGVPSWLLVLFDRLRQVTGKGRIRDVWPG